ncbi:MAG TPA: hypothetical protein VF679_10480, partial [Pedobacter sp.]
MKPLYLTLFLFVVYFKTAVAQNVFPASGNTGIGTTSPSSLLHLSGPFPQIKLEGGSGTWINSDLILSRTSSNIERLKSPNIAFLDVQTGTVSYIQSFQGNLQFWTNYAKTLNITTNNRVGVMTSNPLATFQVESNVAKLCIGSAVAGLNGTSYIGFNAGRFADNVWHLESNGTNDGGAVIYGDATGNINFAALPSLNGAAYAQVNDAQIKGYTQFQITTTGVRAKKLKIELTGWN